MYQESRYPTLLASDFRRIAGSEAVDALLNETVLARHTRADWYPCDGSYEGCPRRIVPNSGDAEHPLVAVCGHAFPMCHDIVLRADELEEYTASQDTFLRVVQRLLGVTGDLTFLDDTYPDCVYAGELSRGDGICDVFVCRAAWDSAFEALLAERQLAARRSVVLVPTARGVPIELLHRYPPGGHVILAPLADILGIRERRLVLLPTFTALLEGRRVATTGLQIIAYDGRRSVTASEYARLTEEAESFDLFLDETGVGHSRTYSAGYRNESGHFRRVMLSALQMHALTELISRGVPLRAAELRSLQKAAIQNPAKVIDSARRLVDVRLSRYSWRSFHTQAAEESGQRRYLFRPPATLRYVCIVNASDVAPTDIGWSGASGN